uniref:Aryl hydrocarbon receptor n=1 Tax=Esox lucius TaxID=8010 RepID=A0A6Q2Y3R9_ESOLU
MYAGRKRRKPVQRGAKQAAPSEGTKSNPSKRHRDRLNSELDRLASLLPFPEEVTSSLDKLSILRLSVSYLRTKNFFSVALKTHTYKGLTANGSSHDNSKETGLVDGWMPEGELLLQALNGFVLVIAAEGVIFYSSHTIQDYLGFHQTDVMHQSVFELIHAEDQQEFRRNLHWALNPPPLNTVICSSDGEPVPSSSLVTYNPDHLPPENSSFLERSFVCRFRCLLDNSSGFLALTLQGRLKFLHGQNRRLDDGCNVPPQLALFAIATPLQPPSILEIRTKNMIFRTKHKLDFTPMACDAKGKIVLGYTEAELRVRGSGYQFIHAADMLYCAENHVRMIKTGESGLTVFRLLTKENRWKWVQANARLVYKNGKPDYIIATQRPLVEEEGGEHLRKRSMHLPFTYATGEALLYQTSYPIHGLTDTLQPKGKTRSKKGKLDKNSTKESGGLDPSSLLGALMRQDESVYVCQPAVEPKMSFHSSLFNGGGSWSAMPNGVIANTAGPMGHPLSSFDPLLTTLDCLSLEGDETCSNSELFSALENLGLNAEDLELLLLDERMIGVEMDPDYIPSLNDLLTNNEILSYIHDSLENRTEEGQAAFAAPTSSPTPDHPTTQAPIVQLSQQMQQHLGSVKPVLTKYPWPPTTADAPKPSQPDAVLRTESLSAAHNGHRVAQRQPDELNRQPQALVDGETSPWQPQRRDNIPGPSRHQRQLPRVQCHVKQQADGAVLNGVHFNPGCQGYSFSHQVGLISRGVNGACSNGHMDASSATTTDAVTCVDYAMGDATSAGVDMNGVKMGSVGLYQGRGGLTANSYHPELHKQQQVSSAYFPSTPYSPLDHILGLTHPQHATPSPDAYGIFNSPANQDAARGKMETGCIFNNTNVAYTGSRLLTNGDSQTASDGLLNPPDALQSLATLPDTQTTGFYL